MSGLRGEALGLADDHVPFVCTSDHNDGRSHCMFCDGGLFACDVCGSLEGATTTQCPGVAMTAEQVDEVYAGRLDYRDGRWWVGLCSRYAPGWTRTWEGRAELVAVLDAATRRRWERAFPLDPEHRGYVPWARAVLT